MIVLFAGPSSADGAGAKLVRDVVPGRGDSEPRSLTNVDGTLFFTAKSRGRGRELWRSDGTRAGTKLVRDIKPGRMDSAPHELVNFDGTLVFRADDGVHGAELWRSDGTRAGTTLVRDIRPGPVGSLRQGTVSTSGPTQAGGPLFFRADDGVHGLELRRTDGTEAGTTLVRDIRPGRLTSEALFFHPADFGGALVFGASDGVHGDELWRSDGTEAGTTLVRDIRPGPNNHSFPLSFTDFGGTLFFSADDGFGGEDTHGRELWRSDGTEAGTTLFKNIRPGSADLTLTGSRTSAGRSSSAPTMAAPTAPNFGARMAPRP